jgi:hypothetical protein
MNKWIQFENKIDVWNHYVAPFITYSEATFQNTPCYLWTDCLTSDNYGVVYIKNKRYSTHRLSYVTNKGAIPDKYVVDHLCRVHNCCNPLHLEAVTHAENIYRGNAGHHMKDKAALITHCPKGHEYTEENLTYRVFKQEGRPDRFKRYCKQCNRDRAAAHYYRNLAKTN